MQPKKIYKPAISNPQNKIQYSKEVKQNHESINADSKNVGLNPDHYSRRNTSVKPETVDTLYCWEDKKGNMHFSNISYPSNEYYKTIKCQ